MRNNNLIREQEKLIADTVSSFKEGCLAKDSKSFTEITKLFVETPVAQSDKPVSDYSSSTRLNQSAELNKSNPSIGNTIKSEIEAALLKLDSSSRLASLQEILKIIQAMPEMQIYMSAIADAIKTAEIRLKRKIEIAMVVSDDIHREECQEFNGPNLNAKEPDIFNLFFDQELKDHWNAIDSLNLDEDDRISEEVAIACSALIDHLKTKENIDLHPISDKINQLRQETVKEQGKMKTEDFAKKCHECEDERVQNLAKKMSGNGQNLASLLKVAALCYVNSQIEKQKSKTSEEKKIMSVQDQYKEDQSHSHRETVQKQRNDHNHNARSLF